VPQVTVVFCGATKGLDAHGGRFNSGSGRLEDVKGLVILTEQSDGLKGRKDRLQKLVNANANADANVLLNRL
jgi:hypothetical protein